MVAAPAVVAPDPGSVAAVVVSAGVVPAGAVVTVGRGVVEQAVDDVRATHGDVSVATSLPDDVGVAVEPVVLRSVLRELLENAVVHADGAGVAVAFVDGEGDIVVSDDGPGIPEYEVEVFEIERETSLKHGSGLGLWLVKWGVDRFGGAVRFDTSDAGTRVHVSVPSDRLTRRAPAAD
ncbi:MAG: ATP-binding protein [Haloferacaceae archaeon]